MVELPAAVAAALWLCGGFHCTAMTGALAPAQLELGLSSQAAGFVVGAALLGAAAGGALAPSLHEALGRGWGLAIAAALLVLGPLTAALGSNAGSVAAGRTLGGLGHGLALAGAAQCALKACARGAQSRLLPAIQLAGALGMLLGFCSALLLEVDSVEWLHVPQVHLWRLVLALPAVPAAMTLVAAIAAASPLGVGGADSRRPRRRAPVDSSQFPWSDDEQEPSALPSEAAPEDGCADPWMQLLLCPDKPPRDSLATALGTALLQVLSGFDILVLYAPALLQHAGAGPKLQVWALVAVGLAGLLGQALSAKVASRHSRPGLILVGGTAAVWFLVLFTWAVQSVQPTRAVLWLCSLVGSVQAGLVALPGEGFAPTFRAQGASLEVFVGRLAGGLSVLLFSFADKAFGPACLLGWAAASALGICWAYASPLEGKGVVIGEIFGCSEKEALVPSQKEPYGRAVKAGDALPVPYGRRAPGVSACPSQQTRPHCTYEAAPSSASGACAA